MAYCEVTDLLIGDTRLPSGLIPQSYVNQAADEIDSAIGFRYETPVTVTDDAVNRPTRLLLKTINSWLATGRIILTISRNGEDNTLDALGKYYVNSALQRINQIADGEIILTGATEIATGANVASFKGPTIVNAEPVSLVDRFYGGMNPSNPEWWQSIMYPGYSAPRPGVTP